MKELAMYANRKSLISRFSILILPVLILSLAVLPTGKSARPQAAASPLVVGINADPVTLDPALATEANDFLVARQIFDTLTAYQPGGSRPIPALAESWTLSPNGLTWTFNLRPGVVFQDGSALNADAVVYNFQRWWDPDHPFHQDGFEYFTSFFGGYKGDEGCTIDDIHTGGTGQVIFVMNQPNLPLPSLLAMIAFGIASPANIQAGLVATQPVGSGPYQFVHWTHGEWLSLEENPDYWGRAPFISDLTFSIIPDDTERYNALVNGSIHSAYNLPESLLTNTASSAGLRLGWHGANTGYLGMNRSHAPLGDPLVRQAIAHAINYQVILDNDYTPGDLAASQLLPPVIWGHNPALQGYTYDPQLSISLLTQAGYTLPIQTTLSYRTTYRLPLPKPIETAAQIAADLEAVGIHAELVQYDDSATYLQKANNGDLDLFLLNWAADHLHPDNYFTPILCNPSYLAFGPLDTAFCDNVQSALAEPTFAQQELHFQEVSQQVHDNLPLIALGHGQDPLFYRAELDGLVAAPMGDDSYKDVYFAKYIFVPLVTK
jgi:peptide/nickel transport system substrate-binding protein